jgi:hypothetical protein
VVCEADDDSKNNGADQGIKPSGGGGGSSKPPVCTYEKMQPQPPAGSKYRLGHDASEKGAVYVRSCRLKNENGGGIYVSENLVWVADGEEPPKVDPQAVAQQALAKMKLLGPDVASPRARGKYVVGVPMWLWVNQGPTTYGPQSTSASAGAVTVTATAKVSKVVWRMGDGTSVTCNGPGTPYQASQAMAESPTCGHTYSRTSAAAGGKFEVSAVSTWAIDWQGGGETGQFTEIRETDVQVAIGEVQVVR